MKINPFNSSNPMSWMDAAKVSAILTVASFCAVFLVPYGYGAIKTEIGQFCFEALRFLGSTFFTNFVAFAGIAQLTKEKPKEEQ